jgi:hypothetical protein
MLVARLHLVKETEPRVKHYKAEPCNEEEEKGLDGHLLALVERPVQPFLLNQ